MKNFKAVVPKINIIDAVKQKIDSSLSEYVLGKNRDNLFFNSDTASFQTK